MKPPDFAYWSPSTVSEAVNLLERLENARPLAGGQSLMPMLNLRLAMLDHVVDLNEIRELAFIREANGRLEVGAMTRQRDAEADPLVARACPLLVEALRHVGHRQTRNRGTLGGSLCHLDPAAELPVVAAVLDATMVAHGPEGGREIAFRDFALGYMTPALSPCDLLVTMRFPIRAGAQGAAFVEFARRHGDFAIVSAAAVLELDTSGRIGRASLALGGVTETPIRMAAIETALIGTRPRPETFREVSTLCDELEPMGDIHVSAAYRKHLAGVLSRRALEIASARVREAA